MLCLIHVVQNIRSQNIFGISMFFPLEVRVPSHLVFDSLNIIVKNNRL